MFTRLLLLCLCLPCLSLRAQVADAAPPATAVPAERAADHEALRGILKEVSAALNARDPAGIARHLATPFVFTALNQRVMTSPEQVTALIQEMFNGAAAPLADLQVVAEASDLTVFTGPDHGYCHGTARELYTLRAGGQVELMTHWTATVLRQDGTWKVSTLHVGVNPLDNPILSRAAKSTGGMLVVVLLVGVVLGGVSTVFVKRRQAVAPAPGAGA